MKNALVSTWVSKAKNYKYFFRGQYQALVPEEDAVLATDNNTQRKVKLLPYEQSLKSFKYREALTLSLSSHNPEVVLAMLEEMIERGALELSLAGRSERELTELLEFVQWKIGDYRYSGVLTEVTRIMIDMYSAPLINSGTKS